MISVRGLKKSFGDLAAVDGLSFEIQAGETFGLLGPNGAGKSTTINMLIGLDQPDSGIVEITYGQSVASPDNPVVRQSIGISPQSLSLYEELSARENLNFFGSLYGISGKLLRQRTQWCLEFAGLVDRSNDRILTYSGGMKRRLNLAAALMHEPEILLLDEPTVGVDPQSRNHIFDSIEALKSAGMTVIYTTHYMEEAQRLCDRVAIIDSGSLLAIDTVDQLIQQHGGFSVVTASIKDPNRIQNFESMNDLLVQPQLNDNQLEFFSPQPFAAIDKLKNEYDVQFESLNLVRPNLESVFLTLTGRSLRD